MNVIPYHLLQIKDMFLIPMDSRSKGSRLHLKPLTGSLMGIISRQNSTENDSSFKCNADMNLLGFFKSKGREKGCFALQHVTVFHALTKIISWGGARVICRLVLNCGAGGFSFPRHGVGTYPCHQGQHGSSGVRSYQERKISCWHMISEEKG